MISKWPGWWPATLCENTKPHWLVGSSGVYNVNPILMVYWRRTDKSNLCVVEDCCRKGPINHIPMPNTRKKYLGQLFFLDKYLISHQPAWTSKSLAYHSAKLPDILNEMWNLNKTLAFSASSRFTLYWNNYGSLCPFLFISINSEAKWEA